MEPITKRSATGRDWEAQFRDWAKPPSDTEEEKCRHAITAVRKAVNASALITKHDIEVFVQGSYRNNTNVRLESDVDICVRCTDVFFDDYSIAKRVTRTQTGYASSTYTYAQLKDDVGAALRAYFGKDEVKRGNKAFDLHENTYRVDADVVATFEYRLFTDRIVDGEYLYHAGTKFYSDDGKEVINWPHQNYENGAAKNKRTGRRFKGMVKVLKSLACEMIEKGIKVAEPIPSYLAECLVYNVPDAGFNHDTYTADVRYVLATIHNATLNDEACQRWLEVNEIKFLFHATQHWTRMQAHAFIAAAWRYVGFE